MDRDDRPELLTIWDEARGHIEKSDYDKAIDTYQYIAVAWGGRQYIVSHSVPRVAFSLWGM